MLLQQRSSNNSNLTDFPSKVGSDAVSAFGINSVLPSFLSVAKSVLATLGRSFDAGWLWDRIFALLGLFVESFKTPVTMLRLAPGSLFRVEFIRTYLVGVKYLHVSFSCLFSNSSVIFSFVLGFNSFSSSLWNS